MKPTVRGIAVLLVMLLAGAGIYAGAAFSMKATDQVQFCGSCHMMHEAVRTHQISLHAKLACNECHAPQKPVRKMVFKTWVGTKDFYQNTLGEVFDVIHAGESTKKVVNENCSNCHTMTTINVADVKQYCTDCHRSVPHMSKLPISKRRVADE